jgi:hypothetical protein
MFWFIHGIFHLDVRVFDGMYWSIALKRCDLKVVQYPSMFISKARKRETVGVSTLKVNGETIENSKGKAEALNEQFKRFSIYLQC